MGSFANIEGGVDLDGGHFSRAAGKSRREGVAAAVS
jgi:hypothetical protein